MQEARDDAPVIAPATAYRRHAGCEAQTDQPAICAERHAVYEGSEHVTDEDRQNVSRVGAVACPACQAEQCAYNGTCQLSTDDYEVSCGHNAEESEVDECVAEAVKSSVVTAMTGAHDELAVALEALVDDDTCDETESKECEQEDHEDHVIFTLRPDTVEAIIAVNACSLEDSVFIDTEENDADEACGNTSVIEVMTFMQCSSVCADCGHDEADQHAKDDTERDAEIQRKSKITTKDQFADNGSKRAAEDGEVSILAVSFFLGKSIEPYAESKGPDIENILAEEAVADRQEESTERCAVCLNFTELKQQDRYETEQTCVQKSGVEAANSGGVYRKKLRACEDLAETGEKCADRTHKEGHDDEERGYSIEKCIKRLRCGKFLHDNPLLKIDLENNRDAPDFLT